MQQATSCRRADDLLLCVRLRLQHQQYFSDQANVPVVMAVQEEVA